MRMVAAVGDLVDDEIDHLVERHRRLLLPAFRRAHRLDAGGVVGDFVFADDDGEGRAAAVGFLHLRLEAARTRGGRRVHHHIEAGVADTLAQHEGLQLRRLALVHEVDVALARLVRLAGFLHQLDQAFDAHRETYGRRWLAAEHLDQRIVTATGADGALRAQRVGDPFEHGAVVVIDAAHQARVEHNNTPYVINTRLVRGIDYYDRTVYEGVTDALGAQGTVCAGGRYDPLIQMFGGKPTPAVGFAMGIERLIELMKEAGEPDQPGQCDVYLVHQGEAAQLQAFVLGERIRDAGLDVVMHASTATGPGSFKTQMKKADGSGAAFAVIIGEDELANHTASVKAMRAQEGEQQQSTVPFDDVVDFIVDQITDGGDHPHFHVHDENCNH